MNPKRILAVVMGTVLLVGAPAAVQGAPIFKRIDGHAAASNIVVRGGVIRLGSTVYIHDNSTHAAVGLTGLRLVNGCQLRVLTDVGTTKDEIIAAIAEEDETMIRLGVTAGVSGGGQYANIYLYRLGKRICANNKIFGTSSNIWLQLTYLKGGTS